MRFRVGLDGGLRFPPPPRNPAILGPGSVMYGFPPPRNPVILGLGSVVYVFLGLGLCNLRNFWPRFRNLRVFGPRLRNLRALWARAPQFTCFLGSGFVIYAFWERELQNLQTSQFANLAFCRAPKGKKIRVGGLRIA